jgi:hypothetical protein
MDLIDLEQNKLVTQPIENVLGSDYDPLRWVVSVDDGDTVRVPLSMGPNLDPAKLILTFDSLLQRSEFVPLLKTVLSRLAEQYKLPVDIEFTVSLTPGEGSKPNVNFHLLQCRPQTRWKSDANIQAIPEDLPEEDKVFLGTRMVPQGNVSQVEYIVYVDPNAYQQLERSSDHYEVAHYIGQLNKMLEGRNFILVGPGRWGSSDSMQGVPVTYADIFNSRALVELASKKGGYSSEPSYGTHFFQDLVEAQIYPLAVSAEVAEDYLNLSFFEQAADKLSSFISTSGKTSHCIKLIHVPTERPDHLLEIIMDGQQGLGYISRNDS